MTDPLGDLAAALSTHADVAAMTEVLTTTLAGLLPPDLVRVERRRGLADRLAGRAGVPTSLTVRGADHDLVLRRRTDGGTEAVIVHAVRGVALSRTPVPISEWTAALASELERLAASDAVARAALERLLLG